MAINLSSLINQLTNGSNITVPNEQIKNPVSDNISMPIDNSGIDILKSMLSGDTFSGRIMDLKDDYALIMLNNGSSISAKLSDNTSISVGQHVTFLVEENSSKNISLKPLETNVQESILIDKALEAANLSPSKSNINIVSQMLNMNMPIDAKTLGDMVKYSLQFPDANLNTIANLIRLDIPVTSENIAQFDAYRTVEHSVSGNLASAAKQLNQIFNDMLNGNIPAQPAASQVNSLINILYSADSFGENTADIPSVNVSDVLHENEYTEIKNIFNSLFGQENSDIYSELTEKINNKTVTVKELISAFTDSVSDIIKAKPDKELSNISTRLIEQMINETLKITPENIAKQDGIKNYYKRVKSILEQAEKDVTDENFSAMNKNMNQVKANIDFMNDLNKNMTYFQMPVHLKNSNGDGELYVFTNKKSLSSNPENISALLHLDMDNLGPMDVYVKLNGKHVSTNFCLETEELLDFVYSNIDKLNARLENLGYTTKFEMNVTKKEDTFNFIDDFIEKDIPSHSTSQFVFDTKA